MQNWTTVSSRKAVSGFAFSCADPEDSWKWHSPSAPSPSLLVVPLPAAASVIPMAALACPLVLRHSASAMPLQRSCGSRSQLARRALLVPRAQDAGRAGFASFHNGTAQVGFGVPAPSLPAATERPVVAAAAAAGEPAPAAAAAAAPAVAAPAKKAPSKPRLPALDSLRFFLIAYIGVGHFVSFATKDAFLLKLLTQVNVWVGAFFVISGYVAGYTATELGKYEASPRVKPAGAYTVARVAGYYPLFAIVNILFGAMFAFADNAYNGPVATFAHGLMSATLTQAWFPAHAEVWNAPTWFLSALTFAMVVLPHVLPAIAELRKRGLKWLLFALTGFSLLGKLAYSYDLNAWTLLEGITAPRAHPNNIFWNVTRFHPFYCLLEVLIGVAAVRLVMVEGVDDEGKPTGEPPKPAGSPLMPLLGCLAITFARAAGYITMNDPLTRVLLFVPLFTLAIMRLHRQTLQGSKGLSGFLSHPFFTYLGTISFPIFVLHGALGQLFYKKIIATKVWGGVMPQSFFPAYCAIVLVSAAAMQKFFLENKKVQEISAGISKAIAGAF